MPEDISKTGLHEIAEAIRSFDEKFARQQAINESLHKKVAWYSEELAKKNMDLTASLAETSSLKNYLADVIEHRADGVLAIDLNSNVTAINAVARALLNAATEADAIVPETRLGLPIAEALPATCHMFSDILSKSLSENRLILDVEIVIATPSAPDGPDKRIISASASPIRSGTQDAHPGAIIGAVGTFRDLTSYKALEERARKHERLAALGEMAAGVAHEIRNPLGGIDLFASNLRRKFAEGSAERATCDKIIAATAHLNRIVSDLLVFTRSRTPVKRPVLAQTPIREALDLASDRIAKRELQVTLRSEHAQGKYRLDPDLLSQAFLNVIVNACDMVPQGGTLDIAVSECESPVISSESANTENGKKITSVFPVSLMQSKSENATSQEKWLAFSFADNGPGVPDSAIPKLFNPFFTLRRDGTGLGLAISHRIAQDHGGLITVGSRLPHGAVFTFLLPAQEE